MQAAPCGTPLEGSTEREDEDLPFAQDSDRSAQQIAETWKNSPVNVSAAASAGAMLQVSGENRFAHQRHMMQAGTGLATGGGDNTAQGPQCNGRSSNCAPTTIVNNYGPMIQLAAAVPPSKSRPYGSPSPVSALMQSTCHQAELYTSLTLFTLAVYLSAAAGGHHTVLSNILSR